AFTTGRAFQRPPKQQPGQDLGLWHGGIGEQREFGLFDAAAYIHTYRDVIRWIARGAQLQRRTGNGPAGEQDFAALNIEILTVSAVRAIDQIQLTGAGRRLAWQLNDFQIALDAGLEPKTCELHIAQNNFDFSMHGARHCLARGLIRTLDNRILRFGNHAGGRQIAGRDAGLGHLQPAAGMHLLRGDGQLEIGTDPGQRLRGIGDLKLLALDGQVDSGAALAEIDGAGYMQLASARTRAHVDVDGLAPTDSVDTHVGKLQARRHQPKLLCLQRDFTQHTGLLQTAADAQRAIHAAVDFTYFDRQPRYEIKLCDIDVD